MRKCYAIIFLLFFAVNVRANPKFDKQNLVGKIYQTEEFLFNEKSGKWDPTSTLNPENLYLSYTGNIILINTQDPVKINYQNLKTTLENENVIIIESEAKIEYLASNKILDCKISISRNKNSGLIALSVFFVNKKWMRYYYSYESKIEDVANNEWELESLTLPNTVFNIDDINVNLFQTREDKINIVNLKENAASRARVYFSNNSLSALIYKNNGALLKGVGFGEIPFYLKESNSFSTTYVTRKNGTENDYINAEITITNGLPYNNLYSIMFSYSHFVNNVITESFILKKRNFNSNIEFRLF